MVKRILKGITAIVLVMVCATLWAQQKAKTTKAVKTEKEVSPVAKGRKRILIPQAYLGHSDYHGGDISAHMFDSLMQQGLYAHDSAGNEYNVISFFFNYAEANIYEDSVGNLTRIVDFSTNACFGNSLDSDMAKNFYERIKYGDTIYIERVTLTHPLAKTDTFVGHGMKCVITK